LEAKMIRSQLQVKQGEFWVARNDLARAQASRFYEKLQETLESLGFAAKVHALCAPVYSSGAKGRPPIDPVVYFKMLMVGFLENLPSERAIASRCGDSLMIRRFLGYELDEDTPHHSSFTVIRQRLTPAVFQAVFEIILVGLRAHGLLRGKNLGLDSSVMEANASLRGLEHRNTGEAYWDYVRRLAAEVGVDAEDAAAVRRFDRQRPGRKTRNQEWVNPHDPDAKVAPAKDGATDMLYKPEHVVDLDTGAVVSAEVRLADQADTTDLADRVMASVALVEAQRKEALAAQEKKVPVVPCTLTGDKGFYCVAELEVLQACGLKTVISDPLLRRRVDKLERPQRAVVRRARQAAQSRYGKDLLRRRGRHIERSFAHLLDCGGMRRATLRGQVNLDKRYKIAAATYNLSQLMRHLFGIGTAKQAAAAVQGTLCRLRSALQIAREALRAIFRGGRRWVRNASASFLGRVRSTNRHAEIGVTSTGS
jgi:transposase